MKVALLMFLKFSSTGGAGAVATIFHDGAMNPIDCMLHYHQISTDKQLSIFLQTSFYQNI